MRFLQIVGGAAFALAGFLLAAKLYSLPPRWPRCEPVPPWQRITVQCDHVTESFYVRCVADPADAGEVEIW